MSSQRALSRSTSRVSSSSAAPSAAVRTMTPAVSGTMSLRSVLEPVALGVGELARDAAGGAVGYVDQEPSGQADLAGEPGALVADRVLGDLDEDGLPRGQHRLDLARLAVLVAERRPVDLAGVEHRVAALADVDEGGLHRGQDVLDPAEVDVADQRGLRLAGDVVLDEHVVLEDADLGDVVVLADHHHPVDRLAAGQELGLADDRRAPAAGLAALATALLLGLEPGRPGDRGDLVGCAAAATDAGDGVGGSSLPSPGSSSAATGDGAAGGRGRALAVGPRGRPRRRGRRRRPGRALVVVGCSPSGLALRRRRLTAAATTAARGVGGRCRTSSSPAPALGGGGRCLGAARRRV